MNAMQFVVGCCRGSLDQQLLRRSKCKMISSGEFLGRALGPPQPALGQIWRNCRRRISPNPDPATLEISRDIPSTQSDRANYHF